MLSRITVFGLFGLLLVPGFVPEASAQTTGTLSGIVRDSSGAVTSRRRGDRENVATGSCEVTSRAPKVASSSRSCRRGSTRSGRSCPASSRMSGATCN